MTDEYTELATDLEPLEHDLLRRAAQADEAGATMLARLLETWAHSLNMARSDLTGTERPGTLPNYLRAVEPVVHTYDLPPRLRPDGGRSFETQPEICPSCGLSLDSSGACPTDGCDGPDGDGGG